VAIKDNTTNDFIYYHGVVNNQEDEISKLFGSQFEPSELKFFSQISVKLLEHVFLSSSELYEVSRSSSNSQTDRLLARLLAEGWLARDDRNYWALGARSYLELRSFLERASAGDDDDDDEGGEGGSGPDQERNSGKKKRRKTTPNPNPAPVSMLPQLIIY
jgi:hypothetical protein